MHFEESETDDLKNWLVKRLADISDADSDVLADYVLALVKSEDPENQVQQKCREELIDFLGDNTEGFVKDVFTALQVKSYLPGYIPPQSTSAASTAYNGAGKGEQSRKRSYNDREINGAQDSHYGNGERTMKQPRRGGSGGRGGGRGGQQQQQQNGFGNYSQQPMPTPPPGFPQLDPTNPMSAILAMQAMGFPSLPGFPSFPELQPPVASRKRCKDYDTRGYCAAGSMCPFEHGQDHIVVTSEEAGYDPKNASLSPGFPDSNGNSSQRGFPRGRGRGGRGAIGSNRGGRAPFSAAGPNHNQAITTVVVEQIPDEKFNEDDVRSFFSEFGDIVEITLQTFKRLALIKYKEYGSARKAYESPKVIFDNRFVKVYWYKPDGATQEPAVNGAKAKQEDAEMIDPVEFAKKQESAQQAHEEKAKKLKEAEVAREELEKKIKAQAEERKRLMEKLAAKTGGVPATKDSTSKPTSQNEALRAKLAELEAEAAVMGLSPEEPTSYPAARGRGGYNPYGRAGGFRGRGAPRGGWRGGAALTGGAVARLDNRPRSVEVKAKEGVVDFGSEKVLESLRAHLFGISECASITPSDTSTSAVVAFDQRHMAEIFINSSSNIPGIGATILSWVANAPPSASNGDPSPLTTKLNPGAATFSAPVIEKVEAAGDADMAERDYDVADDDDDRWMR